METQLIHVYNVGTLAYLDTFAGLVPCKVIRIDKPGNGSLISNGSLAVKLTASRGAYKKGEILDRQSACEVIPRSHVRTVSGKFRVRTNYRYE